MERPCFYLVSLSPQVSATDEDRGSFGAISYILGSGSGSPAPTHFTIDKETGQICTSTALDRDEGSEKFDLTVTATDGVRILLKLGGIRSCDLGNPSSWQTHLLFFFMICHFSFYLFKF